jgi:hypothetical protein
MKTLQRTVFALSALLLLGAARPAYGIPAFARKYGLKCTACHEAWPMLNVFGRAFRDNGYRMNNGKDDAVSTDPSYWPIFAWVEENYQYNYSKSEKATVANGGTVSSGLGVLGAMGTLSPHISFRFVPVFEVGGSVFLEQAWIRYNRLFDTDALNIRVGGIEFDLPIGTSSERDFNIQTGGMSSLSYDVPGVKSSLALIGGPAGIELSGHDRGSTNRYVLFFYNNEGGPGSHTLFNTPSLYAHLSHLFHVSAGPIRDVEIGAFGTYATVDVGPDSAALKPQERYGGALDAWLASDALPLHLEALAFQARDNRNLIPGATRDAVWDGGLVQLDYVPALPVELFARVNLIRNTTQGIPTHTGSFADQTIYLVGIQHTVELTSRFEWGWELYYTYQQDHLRANDGTNLTQHEVWAGLRLAF